MRDRIVIGTHYQNIRGEALLKSWDLQTLLTEGMRMERASRGGSEIGGENVNKVGKHSYKNVGNWYHARLCARLLEYISLLYLLYLLYYNVYIK